MEKLLIKNMVCNRCILAVENELKQLDIEPIHVSLGEITLEKPLTEEQRAKLEPKLEKLGFEIISDKKTELIENIKAVIIDLIQNQNDDSNLNLSELLSEHLAQDYSHMSNLFSSVEGITIEKYFIAQKIEKVKELLIYDELTLSEIAHKMNYSSVAYLSSQFKKTTGLTPTQFKKIRENTRIPLDEV